MPNKLESSLITYPDAVLRSVENLVRTGLSLKVGLRKWRGVDLDNPSAWKVKGAHLPRKAKPD
jgi:hypothetical protein